MWLPFLLILSLPFFLFLPLYSLLSSSSSFSLPPLSPFPLSLLSSLSILFLFILFFSSFLSSTFYLYHPFLLLPFLPEYFTFFQSILSLHISYPLCNLSIRVPISPSLYTSSQTLHFFYFSFQYSPSLIPFRILYLIILFHFSSLHPFFRYSNIPSPFTYLYHLLYLDPLIFSHLFSLYILLSLSSISSYSNFILSSSFIPVFLKNFYFSCSHLRIILLVHLSFISSQHFLLLLLFLRLTFS